jgi:CopG family nickel-responsive transcriptional regulator
MKNNDTVRFGISINNRLLKHFDDYISEKKYFNRSEAIRDLIRNALVEEKWRHYLITSCSLGCPPLS